MILDFKKVKKKYTMVQLNVLSSKLDTYTQKLEEVEHKNCKLKLDTKLVNNRLIYNMILLNFDENLFVMDQLYNEIVTDQLLSGNISRSSANLILQAFDEGNLRIMTQTHEEIEYCLSYYTDEADHLKEKISLDRDFVNRIFYLDSAKNCSECEIEIKESRQINQLHHNPNECYFDFTFFDKTYKRRLIQYLTKGSISKFSYNEIISSFTLLDKVQIFADYLHKFKIEFVKMNF